MAGSGRSTLRGIFKSCPNGITKPKQRGVAQGTAPKPAKEAARSMGQALKRLLKACWNAFRPALQPLVRRFDARLNDLFTRLSHQIAANDARQSAAIREIELLGDSMIRELARLQAQMSQLEASLLDAAKTPGAPPAEAGAGRLGFLETSRAA